MDVGLLLKTAVEKMVTTVKTDQMVDQADEAQAKQMIMMHVA